MSEKETGRTNRELLAENDELRQRLAESEEALNAIRNGEVDAIMVSGQDGDKIFTLSSAETPYRIILEELSEGVVITKADGTILYCNQRFADLFSTTCQAAVISNISEYITSSGKPEFNQLIKRALKERENGIFSPSTGGKGPGFYYNFSFRPLPPDGMGDICIIIWDITEILQYQNHLQELIRDHTLVIEDLKRSNKELESFAYVASHDLQEPLRMVTSFTQLLEKNYKDKLDDQAREYISFAVDGAKRMYDLLNGLLAYSRIHSKGREFTRTNLNKVLENVTKNLSLRISETDTSLSIDKLPEIYADEFQMTQLFQNLIANGIKFSNQSPRIIVSSKAHDSQIIFSVKDEGIGIESQYFDKIFQIFQRLHLSDQYEGIGIGLAVCKKIAERHGGKIWLESEPGKGSTFYVSLPQDR